MGQELVTRMRDALFLIQDNSHEPISEFADDIRQGCHTSPAQETVNRVIVQ